MKAYYAGFFLALPWSCLQSKKFPPLSVTPANHPQVPSRVTDMQINLYTHNFKAGHS
uniref:Uncharacterized protein n=1 Tax=Anguilla anguilla TaxID=7936 RepID=A0A0E9W778_ANGAN